MTSEKDGGRELHIPPRYNIRGRRQLWFVEGTGYDDFVNGLLTAVLVFVPLLAFGGAL